MKDVFDETQGETQQQGTEGQSQGEQQQQPNLAEGQDTGAADGGTPTPQNTEKHVPLAALEAERGQRKDWKEKALRYEGELKALREQGQQHNPQQERPMDATEMVVNERFNTSELIAREKYADLDEKLAIFYEAVKTNPVLSAQLMREKHPFEYAYKEANRILVQREIGDDPKAYRAKVEAEIRASLQPEKPAQNIPASLADARSAGSRGTTWTGPQPLDAILN